MDAGRRNATVGWASACVVVAMVGLSFASVPLYRIFCQVTGFGGTTQRAERAPGQVADRLIAVRFNADVNQGMAWKFQPVQRSVQVRVGEETLIAYRASNPSNRPIVGVATFNVQPDKAGQYFDKIACFCFNEQRLEPGQTVDMPVSFFIDPKMLDDPNMADVNTITLSYTFFEKPDQPVTVSSNSVPAKPGPR